MWCATEVGRRWHAPCLLSGQIAHLRLDAAVDENNSEDTIADDFGASESKGPSIIVLLVFALIGAGAGGWLGGPILTPVVADLLASSPDDGGGYGGEDDGHGGGYGGGDDEEGPLTIEGLILNPANSGGSRFLIATLVLDTDGRTRAEIEGRDAEVRDLLLTTLASKTIDELSDISNRDVIRQDLRAALNAMLGYDGVHRIFLPQFVIQ